MIIYQLENINLNQLYQFPTITRHSSSDWEDSLTRLGILWFRVALFQIIFKRKMLPQTANDRCPGEVSLDCLSRVPAAK